MAGSATLAVNIVADTNNATKGLNDTAQAIDKVEREAKSAGQHLDDFGGASGRVTTGLRDMSDAVAMVGFPQLAAGMQVAAVGFEAVDGAATLFAGTSEFVAKAQGIWAKATGAVTKAMNFLKVAILTNPIFIIAAILIGIVAAFVLLYQHCEWFREIVDKVFGWVMGVIRGVWDWIKDNWPKLLMILTGPFGIAVGMIVKYWDEIKAFAQNFIDSVRDIFRKVTDFITKPFKDAMQWVKDHFKLPKIDLPDWLPGDQGGAAALTVHGPGAPAGRAVGSGPITININAGVGSDPHAIAREIRRVLRLDAARMGRQLEPV